MIYSKNPSGSVASFIVVAIVLVAAIVGSVWYLNNKDSVSIDMPAGEVAKNDSDQSKDQKDQASQPSAEEKTKKEQAESRAKQKIEADKKQAEKDKSETKPEKSNDKPEASRSQTQSPAVNDDKNSDENSSQSQADSDSSISQSKSMPNTGALPETGPATDILSTVIGIMAIIGSGYVYYHFGRK